MILCTLHVLAAVCILAAGKPIPEEHKDSSAEETQSKADQEASRSVRYYFSSDVEDQINDLTQHRDEQRDGLKVRGSFSYSDGYFRREVIYEADQNGYRVLKDEIQPLTGPKFNPEGRATVRTEVRGAESNYKPNAKSIDTEDSSLSLRRK